MARIRTVKPEFWSSEQIVECSPIARLLFIGMWNFADDNGVIPHRPRTIKMQIFPGDSFTSEQVDEWISELERQRLIGRFEHSGETFLAVTGWHHQKIERPTYKYPAPPESLEFDDSSPTTRRQLAERSPPEGNGKEGKGKERSKREVCSIEELKARGFEVPEALDTEEFRDAWDTWEQVRREMKKPLTPTACKLRLADCEKLGHHAAVAGLRNSATHQWVDIFVPDDAKPKPSRIMTMEEAQNWSFD